MAVDPLEEFKERVRKLKARHPDWFKGEMVKEEAPMPKKPVSGHPGPVVKAPKKAYWDHDDADRNDI